MVAGHWRRLTREIVKSLSLEILEAQLGRGVADLIPCG